MDRQSPIPPPERSKGSLASIGDIEHCRPGALEQRADLPKFGVELFHPSSIPSWADAYRKTPTADSSRRATRGSRSRKWSNRLGRLPRPLRAEPHRRRPFEVNVKNHAFDAVKPCIPKLIGWEVGISDSERQNRT